MVSIVRCKILYHMILNQAKSRSILQVWFSSGWSESTLKEFIESCNLLLESKKLPKNEANLVQHWLKKNVTLQMATNEQFKGTLLFIYNFYLFFPMINTCQVLTSLMLKLSTHKRSLFLALLK